jgi:hypothetical protein
MIGMPKAGVTEFGIARACIELPAALFAGIDGFLVEHSQFTF